MSAIGFKSVKVLKSMFKVAWHPILIAVLVWMKVRYHKDSILFTSAYREDDPGVHGQKPLRGFDIRSYTFADPQKICDDINRAFQYDYLRREKKVAIYHDIGKGQHIHIQVHPNTKYIEGAVKE